MDLDHQTPITQVPETSVPETVTKINYPELQAQETSWEIKKAIVVHFLLFLPYFLFHVFYFGTGISLQGIDPQYKSLDIILLIYTVLFVLSLLVKIKSCLTTHWKAKERWLTFYHFIILFLVLIILSARASGV